MLKQSRIVTLAHRAELATDLVLGLKNLEAKGDIALMESVAFINRVLAARSSANLSATFGHDAVASLTAAQAAFVAGMGHVADAHRRMSEIPEQIGLQPVNFGVGDCPDAIEPAERAPRLAAVG